MKFFTDYFSFSARMARGNRRMAKREARSKVVAYMVVTPDLPPVPLTRIQRDAAFMAIGSGITPFSLMYGPYKPIS